MNYSYWNSQYRPEQDMRSEQNMPSNGHSNRNQFAECSSYQYIETYPEDRNYQIQYNNGHYQEESLAPVDHRDDYGRGGNGNQEFSKKDQVWDQYGGYQYGNSYGNYPGGQQNFQQNSGTVHQENFCIIFCLPIISRRQSVPPEERRAQGRTIIGLVFSSAGCSRDW
jgi:hypothetical protein